MRKSVGGGMRQSGILAAAGLYALSNNIPKLKRDNAIAQKLTEGKTNIIILLLLFKILNLYFKMNHTISNDYYLICYQKL